MYDILKFKEILNSPEKSLHDIYKEIDSFSYEIFHQIVGKFYGKPSKFTPSEKGLTSQDFIYEWDIFIRNEIPWNEWKDIAEEGLGLLSEFIDSELDDYKELKGHKPFMIKVGLRLKDLASVRLFDNTKSLNM